MKFDTYYTQVSDEALFLLMTQGDKQASTTLFRRYEFLGRQIAGVHIRRNCLYGYTDESFHETIHDSIEKSFRYYQLNQSRFTTFCRNSLEQNITNKTQSIILEKKKQKQIINLDAEINDHSATPYHEIIGDNRDLTMDQIIELNNLVEKMSSNSNPAVRFNFKVLLCSISGLSIKETADKLNTTVYRVRQALKEGMNILEPNTLKLK